jgi:hypothetical protein
MSAGRLMREAYKKAPRPSLNLGAGDPKYEKLERILSFHRRVGGAPGGDWTTDAEDRGFLSETLETI